MYCTQGANNSSVVELSDDGKKVQCSICEATPYQGNSGGGGNSRWIKKESLPSHLNTEAHAHSVDTKKKRESFQAAVEHSMQEASAMDENLDFVMLSLITGPAVTAVTCVSKLSAEEQEMWNNYEFSAKTFSAGIDPALAVVEERKRLEQEATNLIYGMAMISSLKKIQMMVNNFWMNWNKKIF